MKRISWLLLGLLILSLTLPALANSSRPERVETFVWRLGLWEGRKWNNTFSSPQYETIYMMAGQTNIINPVVTDVYWWSTTQEHMADFFGKNQPVVGVVQILQKDKVIAEVERQEYAFSYPQGFYGGAIVLEVGEAAHQAFQRYRGLMDEYYEQVMAYYRAEDDYREALDLFWENPQAYADRPDLIPVQPKQPSPPSYYASEVEQGYLVNLEPGTYTLQVVVDGKVHPDSQRTIQVFAPRREGVAYEIRPDNMWTRRRFSNDPGQILYLSGRATFYLTAYEGLEMNLFNYSKLQKLPSPISGRGMENVFQWIYLNPYRDATLEVLRDGEVIQRAQHTLWYVRQTPGAALGYTIEVFDPVELGDRPPSFEGYRVVLSEPGSYTFRLVDGSGRILSESTREVRPLRDGSRFMLYLLPFFPFLFGLGVFFWRRGVFRRAVAQSQGTQS